MVERKTTPAGNEYVRVVLGAGAGGEVDDPSAVIDAEFLFLAGAWAAACACAGCAWAAGWAAAAAEVGVVGQGWESLASLSLAWARPCTPRSASHISLPPIPCCTADDSIVNVRAASRVEPEAGLRSGGKPSFSITGWHAQGKAGGGQGRPWDPCLPRPLN